MTIRKQNQKALLKNLDSIIKNLPLRRKKKNVERCPVCGKERILTKHHIIPKSLGLRTKDKVILNDDDYRKPKTFKLDTYLENLVIRCCKTCHKNIHMEYLKYSDELYEEFKEYLIKKRDD